MSGLFLPTACAWLGWGVDVPRDGLQLQLEAGARRGLADVLWQARQYRRAWLRAERRTP